MAPRPTMLRIIAMPLRRPTPSAPHGMTYYHFQLNRPQPDVTEKPASSSFLPEGGVILWMQNKASDGWASLGKGKEGSWQLKVFQYGERLVDRIDFEELALKNIDPSLGPTISHPNVPRVEKPLVKVPLVYPPSILTADSSLTHLQSLLKHRGPKHRRLFWTFLIAAPLTAPFMIIPIIPNLPFFFCVWRSWSHYRAYRASDYLQTLINSNVFAPEPSEPLDEVYADQIGSVILTRERIPRIRAIFELGTTAESDMYRAVEQARVREQL